MCEGIIIILFLIVIHLSIIFLVGMYLSYWHMVCAVTAACVGKWVARCMGVFIHCHCVLCYW